MKKQYISAVIFIFLFFSQVFAQSDSQTGDMYFFSELSASYNSKFYPGVIKYAEILEKSYPHSALLSRALVYEGESLFKLGRLTEAADTLERGRLLVGNDAELKTACAYWAGRIEFARKDYAAAGNSFYAACKAAPGAAGKTTLYYNSALLYAARAYRIRENFEAAVPLLEYIVFHGNLYALTDYESSAILLFEACIQTSRFQKIIDIYPGLAELPADTYNQLTLYVGDAENALGAYRKAYDLYCSVLASGRPELAVRALQKAYMVSAEHRSSVGESPGTVLSMVQNRLSDYPALVAEFWIRLGIDAYNEADYVKAEQYFDATGKSLTVGLVRLAALYKADISVRTASDTTTGASGATAVLTEAAEKNELSPADRLYAAYQSQLARYAALQQNWGRCRYYASLVTFPDANTLYWKALAEYSTANYAQATQTLETVVPRSGRTVFADVSGARVLYARSLAKTGRTADAVTEFGKLDVDNLLDDNSRLDYAKVLLSDLNFSAAYEQAKLCKSAQAPYIAGLASFDTQNWQRAVTLFAEFLKTSDAGTTYRSYALFYSGYSQYREGDYSSAYGNLMNFVRQYPDHELIWNADIAAANAALQLHRFTDAATSAESAIKSSVSEAKRQEAVLLCAGIYADSGNYDRALETLAVPVSRKDAFALQCRYQSAQILVRKGELDKADQTYKAITADFGSEPIAEESLYRRGELYYTAGRFAVALQRFNEYIREFPRGRFLDSALYFGADSLARTGEKERAILQYTLLLKTAPESTYRYGAMTHLITLYRETGDYRSGLHVVQALLAEYGKQARTDGMEKQQTEFEELVSGTDTQIVSKRAEYESAGLYKTPQGRKTGTELVLLYAASQQTQPDAAALAEKILPIQQKNLEKESLYAAQNAQFLGTYYRQSGKSAEGAEKFLAAAEYFRMNGDGKSAAQALYGAVESFDAAGMYRDSKDAAATLNSLYPDSRQNAAAKIIVAR